MFYSNKVKAVVLCLLCTITVMAQSNLPSQSNLKKVATQEIKDYSYKGKSYLIAEFDAILSAEEKAAMEAKGIKVLNYYGNNAYQVVMPKSVSKTQIDASKIKNVFTVKTAEKATQLLSEEMDNLSGEVNVGIILPATFKKNDIETFASHNGLQIIRSSNNVLEASLDASGLPQLLAHPAVMSIDVVEEVTALNFESRQLIGVNQVAVNGGTGKNLTGKGVVVGVGDGGELGNHIDFNNRVINYAIGTYTSFGGHGDHVSGTAAGAGLLNPQHKGMAPEATLLIEKTSNIFYKAPDYVANHDMVITNNSYGSSFSCTTAGDYNYSSYLLDQTAQNYPQLLQCFAAGNSGGTTCTPSDQGFRTILRSYATAKNVLTVGNVDHQGNLHTSSSRGPVKDGRLKPEVVAVGRAVYSTGRNYNYSQMNGTSSSTPGVSGAMALLYQRYRQLNNTNNPDAALIKAITCNTATDVENAGIDFKTGFGVVNVPAAVKALEENRYDSNSIAIEGQSKNFNIQVPSGTQQVKVLLYWSDKEGTVGLPSLLVNNLDLVVTDASGTAYQPWVLNSNPGFENNLPVRAQDTLNNIEQVTIDNPTAGNYTIQITGTDLPEHNQKFYITYEFVKEEVVLTYPAGKEVMQPGTTKYIRWNAYNPNNNTFSLEYSTNNGGSWTSINNNIAADKRDFAWTIPAGAFDQVRVRVTMNGTNSSDTGIENNIIFSQTTLTSQASCAGYSSLSWDAVSGADQYQVLKLDNDTWKIVATTSATTYHSEYLDSEILHWYTVKPLMANGTEGQRAIARQAVIGTGGMCPWSDDISIVKIELKADTGRFRTSTGFTQNEVISVVVENVGNNDINNPKAYIMIDGSSQVMEVINQTIPSGGTVTYTFNHTFDLELAGSHKIDARVDLSGDTHNENDILPSYTVLQLDNPAISLPYIFDFSTPVDGFYNGTVYGIPGIEQADYNGESGVALSIADAKKTTGKAMSVIGKSSGAQGDLIFTVNFEKYPSTQNTLLNISYYHQGTAADAGDKIWVRGNDAEPWVEMTTLAYTSANRALNNLPLGQTLHQAGQTISSSTQIMFRNKGGEGYAVTEMSIQPTNDPLPVELIRFTAEKSAEGVLLEWATASELNNEYFDIEVAAGDQALAEGAFEVVGTVEGNGTTSEQSNYELLDTDTKKSGTLYYRLVQYDFDGNSERSQIVSVSFDANEVEVTTFPNPFIDRINVKLNNAKATGDYEIKLINLNGQTMHQSEVSLSGSEETASIQLSEALANGYYIIQVTGENEVKSVKVLKGKK